jgi:phage protein D
MGFGPAGSTSAPNAFKQTSQAIPSSASTGGAGVVREAVPMLRTASAASDASTALQEAVAARSERLEAKCFLLPGMRPGDVVEVQSLPDGLSGGPWLLTRVTHRLTPASGGTTVLEGESADGASLLGSLAGAIGGLL